MIGQVAVVADSTCDLSREQAAAYGITIVPLFVLFGDERYRDGIEISHHDFYARMARGGVLPTTSQPAPETFASAFAPHVAAGRSIVCLVIAQRLSGTINAARAAATQFPAARIEVVDSETVSGGIALQAIHAAELASAGSDIETILAALRADRAAQGGRAIVPDLSHAMRTGRVSRIAGLIGSIVRVLPILRFEGGEVTEAARVRTFARAQEQLVDMVAAACGDRPARIAIADANARELGDALERRLREKLRAAPERLERVEAGPAIATHAGAGAAGVFYIPSSL